MKRKKKKMSYGTYLTPMNIRWVEKFAKKSEVTKAEAINRLLEWSRQTLNVRTQKQPERNS